MYSLQGYQSLNTETGYDAERFADTLKDARKQAKYMLSNDYRRTSEASSLLVKIQIWKNEELVDEIY